MRKFLVLALAAILAVSCTAPSTESGYKIVNGRIICQVPSRDEGQKDMLKFAAPALDTVRVGFVGLGMRGPDAVYRFTYIPGVKIVALCDIEPDRVASTQDFLTKKGWPEAAEYSGSDGWKALCERNDIDLVYICTDWIHHVPIANYAMECGKHVAIEVPAANTLDEIWSLVNTSEKTRKHCMMLENCVYDFFELTTLNMARQGLFGEILHVEGAYIHNLEPYWNEYWNNWRMDFNSKNRGDVYPTHGFGPACQLLDIHRKDMLKTLVAVDTKSTRGEDFANGDHTVTMLRTANGKTIQIQHDVTSWRPYSRMYQLTGTNGFANKYPVEGYSFRSQGKHEFLGEKELKAVMETYKHPFTKELEVKAKEVGGHGGMDFIMDYRLVYCLRHGLPLDMDVYDLAEWCSVGPLSSLSITNGNIPVEVPDFTRGSANL